MSKSLIEKQQQQQQKKQLYRSTDFFMVNPLMKFQNTFTSLWANSADDKWMLYFLENRIWHFMQIVSNGDNLHEMSNPDFWKK